VKHVGYSGPPEVMHGLVSSSRGAFIIEPEYWLCFMPNVYFGVHVIYTTS